jgi:fatty acid metabolism transcriptional regulator FadR
MPNRNNSNRLETAVDRAERLLIESIINGTYPPNADLPGERRLAQDFQVARPALREALQRLYHDGWLDIQQGRSTRVRDFLRDGNLNIIRGLLLANPELIPDLVPNLLEMWSLFAPVYTSAAVRRAPGLIMDQIAACLEAEDTPDAYAHAMWSLHRRLIDYCGNAIYGLLFNTFSAFYHQFAVHSYQEPLRRVEARRLWEALGEAIKEIDARKAGKLISVFMHHTRLYWTSHIHEILRLDLQDQEKNQ